MFVDVCYPNNDEKQYIKTAKKLSTKGLCFVYKDKVSKIESDMLVYTALLNKKGKCDLVFSELKLKLSIQQNQVFFFLGTNKRGYFSPSTINQVLIKELASAKKLVGIPVSQILTTGPRLIEEMAFFINLCTKYKVKIFLASFAFSPYELRSKKELESIGKLLGMNTKIASNALKEMHTFLIS